MAEPGELAEKFLQNVKYSLLSMLKGRRRKYTSAITNISSVSELVSCRPYFQIGGVVHRYIGRQTQVYTYVTYPSLFISLYALYENDIVVTIRILMIYEGNGR